MSTRERKLEICSHSDYYTDNCLRLAFRNVVVKVGPKEYVPELYVVDEDLDFGVPAKILVTYIVDALRMLDKEQTVRGKIGLLFFFNCHGNLCTVYNVPSNRIIVEREKLKKFLEEIREIVMVSTS